MSRKFAEEIHMFHEYVKRHLNSHVVWESGGFSPILAKISSVGKGIDMWALLHKADGSVNWSICGQVRALRIKNVYYLVSGNSDPISTRSALGFPLGNCHFLK